VALPAGEDKNEWLAVNVVDFFNEINLVYGSVTPNCTNESCPVMAAGSKYEYLWADTGLKKAIKVSAPEYVDRLMTWIEFQLNNEEIFPTSVDTPFPKVRWSLLLVFCIRPL
jgi:MOB kinase activator 1